jgi:hypothetical protein
MCIYTYIYIYIYIPSFVFRTLILPYTGTPLDATLRVSKLSVSMRAEMVLFEGPGLHQASLNQCEASWVAVLS